MKPGDKVWWFDARTQTIDCKTVVDVDQRAGNVYTYDKTLWIGREAFPTREALCEHYRKIFECPRKADLQPWDFVWIDDKLAELQDRWVAEKVSFDWDDMHVLFEEIARHYYNLDK